MTKADRTRQEPSPLSVAQERAIETLLAGGTDSEAAQAAEVTRQTVNGWKRRDAEFIAALNSRRAAVWDSASDRLRALVREAIEEFGNALKHEDVKVRLGAASKILQAASLLSPERPRGPSTAMEAQLAVMSDF